jgi:hypothetical protein
MARSTNKTDKRSTDTGSRTLSPFEAAMRAKKGLTNAGLGNVREALKLHDLGARFANPCVAAGFFARLAVRPFSDKELEEFEAEGRKVLLALGVDDQTSSEVADGQEVVVSLPISRMDRLGRLHALGLKRSRMARAKGYVELRGSCDIGAATRLVDDLGGTIVVIQRPAASETAEVGASVGDAPNGMARIPIVQDGTAPLQQSVGEDGPTDEALAQRAEIALTNVPAPIEENASDADSAIGRSTSLAGYVVSPEPGAAGALPQPQAVHAQPDRTPTASYQLSAEVINKLIEDGVSEDDIPPFMLREWRDAVARTGIRELYKKTLGRPVPRKIRPPGYAATRK